MASTKEIKRVYQKISAIPTFTSAQILTAPSTDVSSGESRIEIVLCSSQRDTAQDVTRKRETHVSFDIRDGAVANLTTWITEESKDVTLTVAHDYVERQRIIFRTCEDKEKGTKRYFLERWSQLNMLDSFEVTSHHGEFYTDDVFGSVSFHPTIPSRLVYVAEKYRPKEDKSHNKFKYREEWGEGFWGRSEPMVVVFDFEGGLPVIGSGTSKSTPADDDDDDAAGTMGKIIIMDSPKNTSPGQPIFVPEGMGKDKIVWTGYQSTPRRYGIIYCMNRVSHIFESSYDGSECRILTKDIASSRSPHFGSDGKLYYISNPSGGPHVHCSTLHQLDTTTGSNLVLVDAVKDTAEAGFSGIYATRIHALSSNKNGADHIVFTTAAKSTTRPFAVNLSDGKLHDTISTGSVEESWSIIGVGKGQLVLLQHDPQGNVEIRLHRPKDNKTYTVLRIPAQSPLSLTSQVIKYCKPTLESILILPDTSKSTLFNTEPTGKPPALIFPHGGPHGAYATGFSAYNALFAELGIALLLVNYTGSTGQGQGSIDALVGHIGDVDVEDVQLTRDKLAESGLVDEKRIGIIGGSHGGFLGAWLTGKYPDSYRCAILMNPAIDLATFPAMSDIPDWPFSETGLPYDLQSPPLLTPDAYSHLWKASPMSVVQNVKCPLLLQLGGKDRRVPLAGTLNYYNCLKAKGDVEVRLFLYPEDEHGIGAKRVESDRLSRMTQMLFLKEFL